jgi:hypothetical protein
MGQVIHLPRELALRFHPKIIFGRAIVHRLAAKASDLTETDFREFFGAARSRRVAWPRFAIMLVAHEHGRSTGQIAYVLCLHPTSVLHGIRRGIELEREDPDFAELLRLLREEAAQ